MKVKYPTWVEEQLKVIDDIIMSMYDVKLPPDQIETHMKATREQIKPLIAEKIRLISNSSCEYICDAGELSSSTKRKFVNPGEERSCENCKYSELHNTEAKCMECLAFNSHVNYEQKGAQE